MAHRRKVGDVYAVTLPDNKYGFGRLMEDASIQVFDYISDEPDIDVSQAKVKFTVGIFDAEFRSPYLTFIKSVPFNNEDEGWPPMKCMFDPSNPGYYSKYYKGQTTKSTREECIGLEAVEVWELGLIINRLLGDGSAITIVQ
jgi:hypothetical protein